MFTKEERALVLATARTDPGYLLDLLELVTYANQVDVTEAQEARLLIEELTHLCASQLEPGVAARVARFLEEK